MARDTSFLGAAGIGTVLALFVASGRSRAPEPEGPQPARAPAVANTPLCRLSREAIASSNEKLPECDTGSSLLQAFLGPPSTRETQKVDVDVVIAVLPDPVESHLDWAFDSGVEAIRRAFERSDFLLDRFWLPWSLQIDSSHARAASLRNVRGTYPGVLLFRSLRADSALKIVLIVGETPTGGVHKEAMARAIAEHDRILGGRYPDVRIASTPAAARRLRIIGPVFSGSSVSLKRALRPWVTASDPGAPRLVSIVSGGATLMGNQATLTCGSTTPTAKALKADECWPGAITFSATLNPVERMLGVFQTRIRSSLGIDSRRMALLREGTTQYGRQVAQQAQSDSSDRRLRNDTTPLLVPFPMNISSLRGEYAGRPSSASNEMISAPGTTPAVRMSLKDPSSSTENPPALSDLTTPGTDIELDHIASVLVSHRISVLGILATDVRDRIFLAAEMKKRMRDVQLVMFGSNVLYLRPDYNDYLRGMLVITSYPLFLENQWWDRTSGLTRATEKIPFTSDIAEGTFNATLVQLDRKSTMLEYDTPLGFEVPKIGRPPVWVTVVGRGSFAPLLYETAWTPEARYLERRQNAHINASVEPDRSREFGALATLIVIAFIFAFLALQIRTDAQVRERIKKARQLRASLTRKARKSASDRIDQLQRLTYRSTLLLHREFYQLFRFAALCGVFIPIGLVGLRVRAHGGAYPSWAWALLLPAILTAALMAVMGLAQLIYLIRLDLRSSFEYAFFWDAARWRTDWRKGMIWWLEIAARLAVAVLGVFYIVWLVTFVTSVTALTDEGPLFFNRAMQLGSGVSPTIPLALGGALLALWSAWHLARIRMLSETTAFEEACLRDCNFAPAQISLRSRQGVRPVAQIARAYARWIQMKVRRASVIEPVSVPEPPDRSTPSGTRTGVSGTATVLVKTPLVAHTYHRDSDRHAGGDETGSRSDVNAESVRRSGRRNAPIRGRWVRVPLLTGARAAAEAYGRIAGEMTEQGARGKRRLSTAAGVRQLRERLILVVPDGRGVFLLLVLAVIGYWLIQRFGITMEAAVFASHPHGTGSTSSSAFDQLFRATVLSSLMLVAWTLYRLVIVWGALRGCLEGLARTPLGDAFRRLPERVRRLTRLSPLDIPTSQVIDDDALTQWRRMQAVFADEHARTPYSPETHARIAAVMGPRPPLISWSQFSDPRLGDPFVALFSTVYSFWNAAPHAALRDNAPTTLRAATPQPSSAAPRWVTEAETLVALYVVEYVEWVFRHLRSLAIFLLGALLLTTLLLGSYPFQAQSLTQVVFLAEMLAAVVVLISILVQMNRDEVLSGVAGTTAGHITWNWSFVSNVLLYGATPVFTLISWEFPSIREVLFAWVTPAFHMLVK